MYEAGWEFEREAANFFSQIEKSPTLKKRYRLGERTFIQKHAAPHLQAADLLAWEWQRSHGTAMRRVERPWRLTLKSLCERPHFVEYLSDVGIGIHAMVNMVYGLQSNRVRF